MAAIGTSVVAIGTSVVAIGPSVANKFFYVI